MGCPRLTYHQNPSPLKVVYSAKSHHQKIGANVLYFGARYYDSEVSVWLSVDPMSDKYPSTSPYAYVENNPIMFVDPNGMFKDWYKNKYGDVVHRDGHAESITIDGEKYKNIGSTYTHKQDGYNYHYVQDEVVSITSTDNDFGEAMQNNSTYQHSIDVAKNHSSQTVQEVYNKRYKQSRSDLYRGTLELMSGIIGGVLTVETGVSIYVGIRGMIGVSKNIIRSLDDLSSLRGATWKEAKSVIPKGWKRTSLNKGKGIKFVNPNKKGEQILLEKGWRGAKDPLHAGPYMKVSRNGKVTRIPLSGNPTLK